MAKKSWWPPLGAFTGVCAVPIIWAALTGDISQIEASAIGDIMGGASATAAVVWAVLRSRTDDENRQLDLENSRRLQADIAERADAEHQRTLTASLSNVLPCVIQSWQPMPQEEDAVIPFSQGGGRLSFALDVGILNATPDPILEVSLDALWLRRAPEPVADEPHLRYSVRLNDADPYPPPVVVQGPILMPGATLGTSSMAAASGQVKSGGSRSRFYFATDKEIRLGQHGINPIGDVDPVISFSDNHGRRWQRIGSTPPTLLQHPRQLPPRATDCGMRCIWSAHPTERPADVTPWATVPYWDFQAPS